MVICVTNILVSRETAWVRWKLHCRPSGLFKHSNALPSAAANSIDVFSEIPWDYIILMVAIRNSIQFEEISFHSLEHHS